MICQERGGGGNNTSLFTENKLALRWSRGYRYGLLSLAPWQPFLPSLVYAGISSTLSICLGCLSPKSFHFLGSLFCTRLPLVFYESILRPWRTREGKQINATGISGMDMSGSREGFVTASTYGNPEVSCSGARSRPPPPSLSCRLIMTWLRAALRKSLQVNDIYQDRKGGLESALCC